MSLRQAIRSRSKGRPLGAWRGTRSVSVSQSAKPGLSEDGGAIGSSTVRSRAIPIEKFLGLGSLSGGPLTTSLPTIGSGWATKRRRTGTPSAQLAKARGPLYGVSAYRSGRGAEPVRTPRSGQRGGRGPEIQGRERAAWNDVRPTTALYRRPRVRRNRLSMGTGVGEPRARRQVAAPTRRSALPQSSRCRCEYRPAHLRGTRLRRHALHPDHSPKAWALGALRAFTGMAAGARPVFTSGARCT